jgi:quinol monooxygenase YgiN
MSAVPTPRSHPTVSGSIKGGVFYRQADIHPAPPGVVVYVATFLPVRRWRDVLAFFRMASQVEQQLRGTTGVIRYGVRADVLHKRFWTLSVWTDPEAMNAFVRAEPHRTAVTRFAAWAGEGAAFVLWRSVDAPLDWDEALLRLRNPTFYYTPST